MKLKIQFFRVYQSLFQFQAKINKKLLFPRLFLPCLSLVMLFPSTLISVPAQAQYVGRVSSIVTDMNGHVLSEQDPDLKRYPASLTKMMTLYMTFRALQANAITLNQRIPVTIHAASMEPSKLGVRAGSYITVREAILGLVTKSANDAACALGEFIGGGDEARFAKMMTQQARALQMNRTQFKNASGLPDPDQVTTVRDLSVLARHLIIDFPQYYPFFRTPSFYFRGRYIPNHDPLLKGYVGADGLKTGYTSAAGHNLVGSAVQGHVRLVGVVMGATTNEQRNQVMMSALDDGFIRKGISPEARPVLTARTRFATVRGKRLSYRGRKGIRLVRATHIERHRKTAIHGKATMHKVVMRKKAAAHKKSAGRSAVTSRHLVHKAAVKYHKKTSARHAK